VFAILFPLYEHTNIIINVSQRCIVPEFEIDKDNQVENLIWQGVSSAYGYNKDSMRIGHGTLKDKIYEIKKEHK